MTKEEIPRYVNLGKGKSVCIDISLPSDLPGFVRKVIIWKDLQVTVEFDNYGYDEGGIYYVGSFESLDELVENLELYLGKPISDWENFNQTGNYPERTSEFSVPGYETYSWRRSTST